MVIADNAKRQKHQPLPILIILDYLMYALLIKTSFKISLGISN